MSVSQFLQNLNTIEDYGSSSPSSSSDLNQRSLTSNTSLVSNQTSGDRSGNSSSSPTSDDELAIFANTQFFDFDMGCSTDIAATMDDLLMQQEHQLQKSKGFMSSSNDIMFNNSSLPSSSASASSSSSSSSSSQYHNHNHISSDMLDLSSLQQFSLANELLPLNNLHQTNDHNSKPTQSSSGTGSDSLNLKSLPNSFNQHHDFTDPLTLTTQPRLSRIMASPALNSMISLNQNSNPTTSNTLNNSRQSLTASQQLQMFIQQQIHAHGKVASPTQSSFENPQQAEKQSPVVSTTTASQFKDESPANSVLSSDSGATSTDATVSSPPPNSKRRKLSKKSYTAETTEESVDDLFDDVEPVRKSHSAKSKSGSEVVNVEEDKRRRNTAASARFRVKKKLREQEMERTTKDLQDKVKSMETKIMQLEMENRWLKNLVVEKNEARNTTELYDLKKKILEDSSWGSKLK